MNNLNEWIKISQGYLEPIKKLKKNKTIFFNTVRLYGMPNFWIKKLVSIFSGFSSFLI